MAAASVRNEKNPQQGSPERSQASVIWRRLRRSPSGIWSLIILLVISAAAAAAPLLTHYNPIKMDLAHRLKPMSALHWFGTDEVGRDVLTRVLYGGRLSIAMGFEVVLLAGVFGTLLGLLTGYYRGWIDEVLMRLLDIIMAFPPLVLAMAVSAMLGPSLQNAMLATAVVQAPRFTRVVRSEVLVLRDSEYVQAARATGATDMRILFKYILPNAFSPILVLSTLNIGTAILTAASLSFIGLGAQQPTPEWGAMVSFGRTYLLDAPWYASFPGLFIFLVVLSFNLLGDSLRDVLDPRLKGR
jgi:peptide/nickel transport system permease protein